MPAHFTVFQDKKKQYRFNLKAANGEIIATGEAYPDKKACLKGIASIQKNAATAAIKDVTAEAAIAKKPGRPPKAAAGAAKGEAAKKRGRKPKTE